MSQYTLVFFIGAALLGSCSSHLPVKTQQYAVLSARRSFEYEMDQVWKASQKVLNETHKITSESPNLADAEKDWSKVSDAKFELDWKIEESKDKYVAYEVNGLPRKQFVRVRVRIEVVLKRQMGGVDVLVLQDEEAERFNKDSSSAGFSRSPDPDSRRAQKILNDIQNELYRSAR